MSEDRLYQKAISLIKAKNYEGAKLILEELDSPEAASLLNRVNSAIAKQKQAALAQHTNVPEKPQNAPLPNYAKLKPKGKPKANPALVLVAIVVICGVCWLSIQSANQPANYGNSPEDKVRAAVADSFGRDRADAISRLVVNESVVTVAFPLSNISEWFAIEDARLNMPELVCELRGRGFTNHRYQLTGMVETIDAFGNEGTAEGIEVIIEPATIAAINCASADEFGINLEAIAERYDIYPVLR